MTADIDIRAHFEQQAKACDALGSPFTARLCRTLAGRLDRSTATGRAVLEWPGSTRADALALRLCGGLHALVLSRQDAPLAALYPPCAVGEDDFGTGIADAVARHDEALVQALEGPPQTNEIGRAAMILPGLLKITRDLGRPMALLEIGSSAGLNLNLDRFRYDYGSARWGDPASPVRLAPETRGMPPPLDGDLTITSRLGSDIAPIDLTDPERVLRLRSYVWADQDARLARLDAAIALAGAHPYDVMRADAADIVAAQLRQRRDGEAFVLFHTIMWQYMPAATKAAVLAALEEAGAGATRESPIARLRMEPRAPDEGFATLSVTTWPGGETQRLARCDFHGRWIEWTGG